MRSQPSGDGNAFRSRVRGMTAVPATRSLGEGENALDWRPAAARGDSARIAAGIAGIRLPQVGSGEDAQQRRAAGSPVKRLRCSRLAAPILEEAITGEPWRGDGHRPVRARWRGRPYLPRTSLSAVLRDAAGTRPLAVTCLPAGP